MTFKHMQPEEFQSHNRALILCVNHTDAASSPAIDYVAMLAVFERQGVTIVNVDAPVSSDGIMSGPVRIRGLVPYEHSSAMRKKKMIGRIQQELAPYNMTLLPEAEV